MGPQVGGDPQRRCADARNRSEAARRRLDGRRMHPFVDEREQSGLALGHGAQGHSTGGVADLCEPAKKDECRSGVERLEAAAIEHAARALRRRRVAQCGDRFGKMRQPPEPLKVVDRDAVLDRTIDRRCGKRGGGCTAFGLARWRH